MLSGLRQNPKIGNRKREKNLRENRDRNGKVGEGVVSSPAGESPGRGKVEGALERCGGDGDGEIQKVDHGPSKLELSFSGRERKKREETTRGPEIGGEIKNFGYFIF